MEIPSPATASVAEPTGRSAERGLTLWLLMVTIAGGSSLLFGQLELGALAALAGIFAVAHAADLEGRWRPLDTMLQWLVPAGAASILLSLGYTFYDAEVAAHLRTTGIALCATAGTLTLTLLARPVTASVARLLFRVAAPSRAESLAARLVAAALLFSVPGWLAFQASPETFLQPGSPALGAGSLWSGLIGLTLLALGGAGFLVRRDLHDTLRRLGLGPLRVRDSAVILLGVIGLFVANAGGEWIQKTWFPDLWARDRQVNEMIAGALSRSGMLLLGLSAGIGEEISLRGALQPRLGLALTSLLFAALHVQYSWIGIGVILLLGLILGWIRSRAGTTAAIAVHGLYDVLAALAVQQAR